MLIERLKKRVVFVTIMTIALAVLITPLAQAAYVGEAYITSQGAIVIDFETGVELYGYNADEPRVPASMVKLVAVYLVYDAIADGIISMDTPVPISGWISGFSFDDEYSNVELYEDGYYTVSELLDAALVISACAATSALGELLYGSEEAFVEAMNSKAGSLGLGAEFYDSYGGSDSNQITPREMAYLVKALLEDYPEILVKTSQREIEFGGEEYTSTNLMLIDHEEVDGLKTGTTSAAGFCFAGTIVREGHRLIAVTMGSEGDWIRFDDTLAMFDYGFYADIEQAMAEAPLIASPAATNLYSNGTEISLTMYRINDSHYFKLRDIAYLVSGTLNQFEVLWDADNNSIELVRGLPYSEVGGEAAVVRTGLRTVNPTSSAIYVDGYEYSAEAYLIGGNNYFKLRDIAQVIGFGVTWDQETQTIGIDGNAYYEP